MPLLQQLRSRGVNKDSLLSAVNDEMLPVLRAAREALNRWLVYPQALTISSGVISIDWTQRGNYSLALSANVTAVSFIDPADTGWYTLKVVQGGAFTMAGWPSSVKWIGSSAPTITAVANRVDMLDFYWDGEEYIGRAEQNAS